MAIRGNHIIGRNDRLSWPLLLDYLIPCHEILIIPNVALGDSSLEFEFILACVIVVCIRPVCQMSHSIVY